MGPAAGKCVILNSELAINSGSERQQSECVSELSNPSTPEEHPNRSGSSRERLVEVAELYWVGRHKIESIARDTGTSRSTVSRLLTRARDEGVIEFVIHRTRDDVGPLRTALRDAYGVESLIPRIADDVGEPLRRLAVAREAALWLSALVQPGTSLGVTWGSTVEAVSLHLRDNHIDDVRVVQVHGSANVAAIGVNYASRILDRFGRAFDADVHLFPIPTLFDSAATRRAMWEERSIRDALAIRGSIDLIVTSVGTSDESHPSRLYQSGLLRREDIRELREQKVVGNLASVFFRSDGSTDGISLNERSTGIPLNEFREIPLRLFVVASSQKAEATRAVLTAGLVTHLVIDPETAARVLE